MCKKTKTPRDFPSHGEQKGDGMVVVNNFFFFFGNNAIDDYLQIHRLKKKRLHRESPNLHLHTLKFRFKCKTFIVKTRAGITISFL